MYIPVFEIKDSFIVKHKLQYNTSCNISTPNKIMFTDYDLARKSQTTNAVNFSGITMDVNLSGVSSINMSYFDQYYEIAVDGNLIHEDVFSGTTVINNTSYQQYYVPDGTLFNVDNERVNIEIYQKVLESGTTFWDHYAYVPNDIWTLSGETTGGYQWIVTGTTTVVGYSSGYTNWYVEEITPILLYLVDVINTGATYIRVSKKIEDYLFNNLMKNYDNLYYKTTSINHTAANYNDLYLKLLLFPRAPNFDITLNTNSIYIKPVYNEQEIYFNYDALTIDMGGVIEYTFDTDCLYNKYNLELFFDGLGVSSGETIFEASTTDATPIGYTFGDYYMSLDVYDLTRLKAYSYVKIEATNSNTYDALIIDITGNTATIIAPLTMTSGDIIHKIYNITTVREISDLLQITYENYEQGDYRKLQIELRKNIYNTYAEIINQAEYNQEIRMLITGLIFENDKKIMVLKVFDPADFIDERLLYEPIEIVRIGKDRKTSIPVPILEFTKGLTGDVIDENIYSVYLFNPNIYNVLVIDANMT